MSHQINVPVTSIRFFLFVDGAEGKRVEQQIAKSYSYYVPRIGEYIWLQTDLLDHPKQTSYRVINVGTWMKDVTNRPPTADVLMWVSDEVAVYLEPVTEAAAKREAEENTKK